MLGYRFFGGFTKTMDCVQIPLELPCLEQGCRADSNSDFQHRLVILLIIIQVLIYYFTSDTGIFRAVSSRIDIN